MFLVKPPLVFHQNESDEVRGLIIEWYHDFTGFNQPRFSWDLYFASLIDPWTDYRNPVSAYSEISSPKGQPFGRDIEHQIIIEHERRKWVSYKDFYSGEWGPVLEQ